MKLRLQASIVLFLLFEACALSLLNVEQTSPVLDGLSVTTTEEENDEWIAKETRWRDQSGLRAWLRVEQLKGQYGDTGFFHRRSYLRPLLSEVMVSDEPAGFNQYDIVDEGIKKNGLGEIEFLHLRNPESDCLFTRQFSPVSPMFENYRELLGHTEIRAWYCAEVLNTADVDKFVRGFDFY
jgi:hypothetical protein